MAFTLCSSGAATAKAGLNVSSTLLGEAAILDTFSDETEGFINAETRRDWITNAPSANLSGALADITSSHIAMKMINYDMSGYTSRLEAQTMLDVNVDITRKGIAFLKLDENQEINK